MQQFPDPVFRQAAARCHLVQVTAFSLMRVLRRRDRTEYPLVLQRVLVATRPERDRRFGRRDDGGPAALPALLALVDGRLLLLVRRASRQVVTLLRGPGRLLQGARLDSRRAGLAGRCSSLPSVFFRTMAWD